jgi:hypothetical protein
MRMPEVVSLLVWRTHQQITGTGGTELVEQNGSGGPETVRPPRPHEAIPFNTATSIEA